MKVKNKYKSINIWLFILMFTIIGLGYVVLTLYTAKNQIDEQYKNFETSSVNSVKSYSHSLSKSAEAQDIMNELLKEKILVASKSVLLVNEDSYSNDLLRELAKKLEVDEINIYNSDGFIKYSSIDEYVGNQIQEDHPAYPFLNSKDEYFIEDIRKDQGSDLFVKYGYYRSPNGKIIQIGVLATKIQDFLGQFEIQYLIDEMQANIHVKKICFINNNFKIIGSTDEESVGKLITDPKIINGINKDKEWGYLSGNGIEDHYVVSVPVYVNDSKIGTLTLQESTQELNRNINRIILVNSFILLSIFITVIPLLLVTYNKSKKQVQLTYFDSLTHLPNGVYLTKFLSDQVKDKKNKKAVLLINCLNFRMINLTYGINYGDDLLIAMAERLNKLVTSNLMLFRFTADRFILYVENYKNKEELVQLIQHMNDLFKEPLVIQEHSQFINIQVGLVEINDTNEDVDRILKDALIVINQIKNDQLNYVFFDEVMEGKHQRDNIIENELRFAMAQNKDQIYLQYQPLLDLKNNRVVGFEALARMSSKTLGNVSPLEFIKVAETNQLIAPLGEMIFKSACQFLKQVIQLGYEDLKVSINVSVVQLLRDDFVENILNIIGEVNVPYQNLEVEITESVLLDNYTLINEKLGFLRSKGIEISIDDFGTGFSSFARLKELNVDILKIDRYFINDLLSKDTKKLMTPVIISVAHNLDLKVIAEGVELEQQKEYLMDKNCDIMQGYLYSRPLSVNDAIKFLKENYKK